MGHAMPCRPVASHNSITQISPTPLPCICSAPQWVHPGVNGVAIAADPRPLHNDLHTYLAGEGVKMSMLAGRGSE